MTEPCYLLDTNICIDLLAGRSEKARARIEACRRGEVVTSAIVRAEVMLGAKDRDQNGRAAAFFTVIEALPFDAAAADMYARLPSHWGSMDRLIGAHALALDLTLVTNNESDFADVPGLRVENWTR